MGARPQDYEKVAPLKSYIHVDEFHGPKELAEYLHLLDNDDELYNQYFQVKEIMYYIDYCHKIFSLLVERHWRIYQYKVFLQSLCFTSLSQGEMRELFAQVN